MKSCHRADIVINRAMQRARATHKIKHLSGIRMVTGLLFHYGLEVRVESCWVTWFKQLSTAEVCERVKKRGYSVGRQIWLCGERMEVDLDPFLENGLVAIRVRTKRDASERIVEAGPLRWCRVGLNGRNAQLDLSASASFAPQF